MKNRIEIFLFDKWLCIKLNKTFHNTNRKKKKSQTKTHALTHTHTHTHTDKKKCKKLESIPAERAKAQLLYKRGECVSENPVTISTVQPSFFSCREHSYLRSSASTLRWDPRPLAQPGCGHPLWLSVQLVYQPAQLVESLVWIHVHDGRIKEVAKIVLHLAGLFNNCL